MIVDRKKLDGHIHGNGAGQGSAARVSWLHHTLNSHARILHPNHPSSDNDKISRHLRRGGRNSSSSGIISRCRRWQPQHQQIDGVAIEVTNG